MMIRSSSRNGRLPGRPRKVVFPPAGRSIAAFGQAARLAEVLQVNQLLDPQIMATVGERARHHPEGHLVEEGAVGHGANNASGARPLGLRHVPEAAANRIRTARLSVVFMGSLDACGATMFRKRARAIAIGEQIAQDNSA